MRHFFHNIVKSNEEAQFLSLICSAALKTKWTAKRQRYGNIARDVIWNKGGPGAFFYTPIDRC